MRLTKKQPLNHTKGGDVPNNIPTGAYVDNSMTPDEIPNAAEIPNATEVATAVAEAIADTEQSNFQQTFVLKSEAGDRGCGICNRDLTGDCPLIKDYSNPDGFDLPEDLVPEYSPFQKWRSNIVYQTGCSDKFHAGCLEQFMVTHLRSETNNGVMSGDQLHAPPCPVCGNHCLQTTDLEMCNSFIGIPDHTSLYRGEIYETTEYCGINVPDTGCTGPTCNISGGKKTRKRKYTKKKKQHKNKSKKTFLYNPEDPKKSFDVYIDKNPKDTIPIKYATVQDVKHTIKQLERLYKSDKYEHKRIWQVGMIMKVRLEAMKKHKDKLYRHAQQVNERHKLAENYFVFLGKRTKEKDDKQRKQMKFKM